MARYGVYKKTRKKSNYVTKGTGTKISYNKEGELVVKTRFKRPVKKNLEIDTRRLVGEANERLRSLERRYKSGTWASKRLRNLLSSFNIGVWKGRRIKLRNNLNTTQLVAINKAITSFLKSKTATKQGIEDVKRQQIENIKERLGVDEEEAEEMTDEEAEFFYDMFGDRDFDILADKVGASALQACIEDSIEANDTEDQFLKRLEWYGGVEMNDLDIREIAIRVYNKYVRGR